MAKKPTEAAAEDSTDAEVDEAEIDATDAHSEFKSLEADNLIKNYVIASVGASIVPVALFDIAAVATIQLRMIQKLSALYEKPFSERLGRKVLYALVGSVLGYGAGYVVAASASKVIPGVGWMIGLASLPLVAGAATYAVGQSIVKHYEEGGTLMDFDAGKMRNFYKEQYEKGKKFARRAADKVKPDTEENAA